MTEAKAALDAKQYDKAAQLYRALQATAPPDLKVEVLANLAKAEQGRAREQFAAHRSREEQEKKIATEKFLDNGKANLKAQRYDVAVLALQEALKLSPNHPEALAALKEAQAGISSSVKEGAEKNAAEYSRLMTAGRRALADKQYDLALKNFNDIQRLLARRPDRSALCPGGPGRQDGRRGCQAER